MTVYQVEQRQNQAGRGTMRRRKRASRPWKILFLAVLAGCGIAVLVYFLSGLAFAEIKGALGIEKKSPLLDVPFLSQREEFPTGCESVSAAMVLNYWEISITPGEFIDQYLIMGAAPHQNEEGLWVGCDPRTAFPGDPRTDRGWGCFPPVIVNALKRAVGEEYSVEEHQGESLESLYSAYVAKGVPVLVWATIGMAPASEGQTWLIEETGEEYTWTESLHCLVLTGVQGESYLFNDPMEGKDVSYGRAETEAAYLAMGQNAVTLEPVPESK